MSFIAAVVATHNRPQFLANRSLASIALQTRLPDLLVVVDDSDPKVRRTNEEIVADFRTGGTRTVYLENYRTPGAAGAWNTALSELQDVAPHAFVAILDDDDDWEPDYLELCEKTASESDLDMVVAGLIRHETADAYLEHQSIPDRLDADSLLVRNPHIQGSNLYARLRKLLEAGGFDESLASTTDRDICIRLADLGTVRYGSLDRHLVHHHADFNRLRLSTPGGDAKCAGLRRFFLKYRGRMSDGQCEAFLERSRRLFKCDPSAPVRIPTPGPPVCSTSGDGEPLDLVVGAITSPDVSRVSRLMDSLIRIIGCRADVTMKLVLLENGDHDPPARRSIREALRSASDRGLDVDLMTLEQQVSDVEAGVFAAAPEHLSTRKSIALSRTMLQHYLFLEAKPRLGSVVWILDDDVVLEGLAYGTDGSVGVHEVDYVSAIKDLKKSGSCAVLGEVTGDPPLPFLGSVRTQLVDLYHNLHQLAELSQDAPYPDRQDENRLLRLSNRDYYYDLSRDETDHLEAPFWYAPRAAGMRAGQVLKEMVSRLPEILAGRQVFRPLVQTATGEVASGLMPSVNRGPSTLVFDLQALREFPNTVPEIDGADMRRSDMVWSLLNRFVGGCRIARAPLPVRQDRKTSGAGIPDFESMAQDIHGYALYSSMHDVFLQRAQRRQRLGREPYGRGLMDFAPKDIERAIELYGKYVRERARAFELGFIRVVGIISALRPFYDADYADGHAPWWTDSAEYGPTAAGLQSFARSLESIYTEASLQQFRQILLEVDTSPVVQYLTGLPDIVARHRANTPLPREELRRAAAAYVREEFGTGHLRTLGVGEEGVVLTDGKLVYKYFHYWKARDRDRRIAFLQSLEGSLSEYGTLPDIREVRRRGDHVVAVYPYEPGTRYEGGHLDGMLTLLRECRDAGVTCRNIHPDNLLVTPSGLKLIDFGSDIVPSDDGEFEQMCRRAFLSYRFHYRSDLKSLMTRALTDDTLPELTGIEHFRRALDPRGFDELFHRPLAQLVLDRGPGSVLDYGCGDGRLTERLASEVITVTGYDPDAEVIERCRSYGSQVRYGTAELRGELIEESARFDLVVCSRVLCTIEDPGEFDSVLRDLRRLVTDSGTVMVAVCNPFHLATVSTELAEKHLPANTGYRDTFSYRKSVAPNGNMRREVHRSFATYRRAITDAGLRIAEVVELDGTDTRSLQPASDHLVFTLNPLPESGPCVSLLIKTCLMEWRTIERLVRHQVGQLEGAARFTEKVIVVDPFEGPFSRQYDGPDPDVHRASMERLLEDGVVDRVVYAPRDPAVIRDTYRRWFGVDSVETHSENGQQLFATLFGFDACTGDYVLQLDSDLLISRTDGDHDYLGDMVEVLQDDPRALFVPLSIFRSGPLPYTPEGPDGDWRVEVRGCLFDRRRLHSVLPVANELTEGRFVMPWHRAFDRLIASSDYRSYRGGDPGTAFIHVPNDRKADPEELLEIVSSVERGHVPSVQLGKVDLVGSALDWAGPKRTEPFVFIVCGRNVGPGRFKRCLDSLAAQEDSEWGAIVVDDASTNGFGEYAEVLLAPFADRVTLVQNETRRGTLHNTWKAVTGLCTNPETVIITLDADDALIGRHVLCRVRAEYADGADLTVGSMLRLDKDAHYPADFDNPRSWRSNVWQHLRTFRKYLFDAIDVNDLKLDGEWIDLANDWSFMVPMVEMASSPRHIQDHLYLYEPAAPRSDQYRRRRDSIIQRILAKPRYSRLVPQRHA